MKKFVDTEKIILILKAQLEAVDSSSDQFSILKDEIEKVVTMEEIDPNFKGTLQEIKSYVSTAANSHSYKEHIKLNDLNIKRWIEELERLMRSEAVTIDYEQRKGREI
ncbi:YtzH-like family protein [Bacillus alkalicellulosilyticus]|uniref:YtzH-like family protein n=1 Tax=Alkalihalobacterium alkalicellulosilyticum TaxID=1912214 RepID=UPI000996B863|nr:YtzH-like family protein [Bacillus alkalicellulosilyticus]